MNTPGAVALRWLLALAMVTAGVVAILRGGSFLRDQVSEIAIFAIFAMGIDLVAGVAGLMSIGHAMYFGMGAYALAWLTTAQHWSAGAALAASVVLSAAAGALVGAAIVRFADVVFITLTLVIAEMFYAFLFGNRALGGSDGISGVPRPDLSALGLNTSATATWAALVVGCAFVVFVLIDTVARSPFGLLAAAVRQNAARARALGTRVFAVRTAVYALSAGVSGFAGALLGALNGFVSPDLAGWALSGLVLLMAILGGIGSISGAALGAVLIQGASHVVSRQTEYWGFVLGVIFIVVVLFGEDGLFALLLRATRVARGR